MILTNPLGESVHLNQDFQQLSEFAWFECIDAHSDVLFESLLNQCVCKIRYCLIQVTIRFKPDMRMGSQSETPKITRDAPSTRFFNESEREYVLQRKHPAKPR